MFWFVFLFFQTMGILSTQFFSVFSANVKLETEQLCSFMSGVLSSGISFLLLPQSVKGRWRSPLFNTLFSFLFLALVDSAYLWCLWRSGGEGIVCGILSLKYLTTYHTTPMLTLPHHSSSCGCQQTLRGLLRIRCCRCVKWTWPPKMRYHIQEGIPDILSLLFIDLAGTKHSTLEEFAHTDSQQCTEPFLP